MIAAQIDNPTPDPTKEAQSALVSSLFYRKGTLIAQGTNTRPVGTAGLTTYRLDEIRLPAPTTFAVAGQQLTVTRVWRLTVPIRFYIEANSLTTMRLGDTDLGATACLEGCTALSVLIYDRSVLREGSTIAVGAIGGGVLPETLHFLQQPAP